MKEYIYIICIFIILVFINIIQNIAVYMLYTAINSI